MSGDAKRFRATHGSAGRHGETFWQEEKDNIGLKLLRAVPQSASGLFVYEYTMAALARRKS